MIHSLTRRTLLLIMTLLALTSVNVSNVPKGHAASLTVTTSGSNIVVNTGAGLVYTINHLGDLISAKMNGIELNGSRPSHTLSGFPPATVSYQLLDSGSTVLITVATQPFTHYYASRAGENIIYMATNLTEAIWGEFRYIFRGNASVLTNRIPESRNEGSPGPVESGDIYGQTDGRTTSKYYGNERAKDLSIKGITGNGVGVFMAYGNRERSSGGPFFRDIQFQDSEVYNYTYSGHSQTEPLRLGLHGPYAYVFTTGSTPNVPAFDWMSSLNLQGWVSDANRGRVILNGLNGIESGYEYTIGFANSNAQYWVNAAGNGAAQKWGMIPGTYVMTVYKGELAVYTENVTVNAGAATTLNTRTITNDPSTAPVVWRIGKWDGTPLEFKNGENISKMHPSDIRNESWGPTNFTVGSPASLFPAVQFRGANTPTTISFNLTAAQAASDHTLKIGITTALYNGRPNVTINGHNHGAGISAQPVGRNITIGTYRGNNTTYTYRLPASQLVAGTNTMNIGPISGSGDLGSWLSASFAYDAIELQVDNHARIQSYNFQDRYIRHANFEARIDPNVSPLGDSQFNIVPGLSDGSAISFESANFPGYYLRHSNYELRLEYNDGTSGFRDDATFRRVNGHADSSWVSYQSYNFPNRYIRHYFYELRIDPISTQADKNDATFKEIFALP